MADVTLPSSGVYAITSQWSTRDTMYITTTKERYEQHYKRDGSRDQLFQVQRVDESNLYRIKDIDKDNYWTMSGCEHTISYLYPAAYDQKKLQLFRLHYNQQKGKYIMIIDGCPSLDSNRLVLDVFQGRWEPTTHIIAYPCCSLLNQDNQLWQFVPQLQPIPSRVIQAPNPQIREEIQPVSPTSNFLINIDATPEGTDGYQHREANSDPTLQANVNKIPQNIDDLLSLPSWILALIIGCLILFCIAMVTCVVTGCRRRNYGNIKLIKRSSTTSSKQPILVSPIGRREANANSIAAKLSVSTQGDIRKKPSISIKDIMNKHVKGTLQGGEKRQWEKDADALDVGHSNLSVELFEDEKTNTTV